MPRAGLIIYRIKSDWVPYHERLNLDFNVNLAAGLFRVSVGRWDALRDAILASLGGRMQSRSLANLVGNIICMTKYYYYLVI